MILTKFVNIGVNIANINRFKKLGYKNLKFRHKINIPVEHLSKGSKIKIKVKCDIPECGKEKELGFQRYLDNFNNGNFYACSIKCAQIKIKQTSLKLYGVENFTQTKEYLIKTKNTKKELYGNENYVNIDKLKEVWKNRTEEEINNIVKKREQTKENKYGDKNFNNRPKMKETKIKNFDNPYFNNIEKCKQTWIDKYGVENIFQLEEIKEKSRKIKKDKYGNPNFVNVEKRIKTLKNRSEAELQEILEKHKKTILDKYGVEHVMQNVEIFNKQQKNSFKLKEYRLPSGKIVKIQGYENLTLDYFFYILNYKEEDILIKDKNIENRIGKIFYYDNEDIKHRYYPDLYIVSENKIIETKSEYTFKCNKKINLLKKQACINSGFDYEFIIFNEKKELLTEEAIQI